MLRIMKMHKKSLLKILNNLRNNFKNYLNELFNIIKFKNLK